jgi:hypothetical protein
VKDREVSKNKELTIETLEEGKIYKDLDFAKTFGYVKVEKAGKILDALEKDSALFECRGIMDYSLLLVICKKDETLVGRHVFQGDVYTF